MYWCLTRILPGGVNNFPHRSPHRAEATPGSMHSRSLGRNSAVTSTSSDQAPGERCYGVVRFCGAERGNSTCCRNSRNRNPDSLRPKHSRRTRCRSRADSVMSVISMVIPTPPAEIVLEKYAFFEVISFRLVDGG